MFAQQRIGIPGVNSDVMTYFQEEMVSLMQFEIDREKKSPFFISFRMQLSEFKTPEEPPDVSVTHEITNAMIGIQIKLNNNINIPIFCAISLYDIVGSREPIGLFSPREYVIFSDYLETVSSGFIGTGVTYNSTDFNLGVYFGLYENNYELEISESFFQWRNHILFGPGWWRDYDYIEDKDKISSFKAAIIPQVNTSSYKFIGSILNSVFGYVGLGDSFHVYTEEKNNNIYKNIVDLLNLGLTLSFNKIRTPLSLEPKFYYNRVRYDSLAKNDIFGFFISSSFWRMTIDADFGYRNFNSVLSGFEPIYQNTWFVSSGITLHINHLNLSLIYEHDSIRQNRMLFLFNLRNAFSLLAPIDLREPYKNNFIEMGYRYRFIPGGFLDLFE